MSRFFFFFFWAGRNHKIATESLCRPKVEDGIGLRLFKDLHQMTLLKLLWTLLTKDYMWSALTINKYLQNQHLWVMAINNNFLSL